MGFSVAVRDRANFRFYRFQIQKEESRGGGGKPQKGKEKREPPLKAGAFYLHSAPQRPN